MHVPSDWYSDFFTEVPNEFWRRALPPGAAVADVEFIERRLDLAPRSKILDVPCGSGRHALVLAARGYRVVGVDISPEAVDHARRLAAGQGLDVDLAVAEMRDVPRDGSFDAAICMGNSVGYLDLAGLCEFVAAVACAVRPGGGLVIDYAAAAESVLPGYAGDEQRSMDTGDITVCRSTTYDVAGSRLISAYRFSKGAQEVCGTAIHHVYTTGHLVRLLTDAGFSHVAWFGGADGEPYVIGTGRLLLTGRRTGSARITDCPRTPSSARFRTAELNLAPSTSKSS